MAGSVEAVGEDDDRERPGPVVRLGTGGRLGLQPPVDGYQIWVTSRRGPAWPPGAGFTTSPALRVVVVHVTVLIPILEDPAVGGDVVVG